MNYTVEHLINDTYQVYSHADDAEFDEWKVEFQGSLSDCEAWIRLKIGGYL